MKVTIISPGYASNRGGVTAHTGRLVKNWTALGAQVQVIHECDSADSVAESARDFGASSALIHYVPFLYGRRGLSRFPLQTIKRFRSNGIRTTIFVHEPGVPPTRLPWIPLSILHRWQLNSICGHADNVVTPVPDWLRILKPGAHICPVGSTLGEMDHAPSNPDFIESPVVFSPFAAGLNWKWIAEAVKRIGAPTGLTIIGADTESFKTHHETGEFFDPGWQYEGYMSGEEVLSRLSVARVVLAPYVDGLTSRRTSAMAALGTGARLLSSRGPLLDPFFENEHIPLASSSEEFADMALSAWSGQKPEARQKRIDWFQQTLSSELLDERLLRLVTNQSTPAS
jgi:hypothetical protein